MIAGIVLAVLVPMAITAWCCCRRQRRLKKKGRTNKTLDYVMGSRHSLNGDSYSSTGAKSPMKKSSAIEPPTWTTKDDDRDSPSSGIGSVVQSEMLARSSAPNAAKSPKSSPNSNSTFASSSPSAGSDEGTADNQKGGAGRRRYDAVYYTHEPIQGAPNGHFEEKEMDVELDHRNTAV